MKFLSVPTTRLLSIQPLIGNAGLAVSKSQHPELPGRILSQKLKMSFSFSTARWRSRPNATNLSNKHIAVCV